jgi:predicted enzyme related to lactoylglutathione lyase
MIRTNTYEERAGEKNVIGGLMGMKLAYAIEFVADMGKAVAFYRDTLGLKLRFESPEWSELETGATTLALHRASEANPPGKIKLGFNTDDIHAEHQRLVGRGVRFTMPPTAQKFGGTLANFLDCEGADLTLGGK